MRKKIALAAALVAWPVLGFAQEKPAPAQASSGQTQAAAPREDRVKALEEQANLDESRPVIEYYRRRDEVDILVPIV